MATLARGALLRGVVLATGMVLGLVSSALLVRALGIVAFGALALALTILNFAATVADLGLGSTVARMTAFEGAGAGASWSRTGSRIAAIGGTLGTLACVAVALALGPPTRLPLLILAPAVLAAGLRPALSGYLMARRGMVAVEGSTFGQFLVGHGSAIAMSVAGVASTGRVALAYAAARYASILILLRRWRSTARADDQRVGAASGARGSTASVRRLLAFALPLLLSGMSVQAVRYSDIIILGVVAGPAAAGLYVLVIRIPDMTRVLLRILGSYYVPVTSELVAARDTSQLELNYTTVAKWATVLASPLLAAMLVSPVPLLTFAFGQQLSEAGGIARLLIVGYAVNAFAGLTGPTLVALGKTRAIGIRSATAFVVNIALNLVLIPVLGVLGAALSTTIVAIGLNLANSILVWKTARFHQLHPPMLLVLLAVASATAAGAVIIDVLGWNGSLAGPVFVAALVGVVGLATALLTLTDQESALFARFRSRLRRRRAESAVDTGADLAEADQM